MIKFKISVLTKAAVAVKMSTNWWIIVVIG